jgi:DNA-binding NarL/FixJ family response regulator
MNVATIPVIQYIPHFFCESCSAVANEKRERERRNEEFVERVATLSARERQVMFAICGGQQPVDIAATLNISVKTVSTYRQRILEKLGLRSNVLVALACDRAGFLAP